MFQRSSRKSNCSSPCFSSFICTCSLPTRVYRRFGARFETPFFRELPETHPGMAWAAHWKIYLGSLSAASDASSEMSWKCPRKIGEEVVQKTEDIHRFQFRFHEVGVMWHDIGFGLWSWSFNKNQCFHQITLIQIVHRCRFRSQLRLQLFMAARGAPLRKSVKRSSIMMWLWYIVMRSWDQTISHMTQTIPFQFLLFSLGVF